MHSVNEVTWHSYRRHLTYLKRSPRTIQSYEESIDQFAQHFGDGDVLRAGKADVQNYLTWVGTWAKPTTVGVRFRSLRAFFNWAVEEELLDVSPMRRLDQPAQTEEPVETLTDDELKALLATCKGRTFENLRDEAMILLFCEAGSPRVSEMAGMTLEALDLKRDRVKVTGKGDKIRFIPFGARTGTALDRYLRERTKHRLAPRPELWLGMRGMWLTPNGIQQMIRKRGARAGIEGLHPHALRHTAAHRWKDAGGSEEDAEELFGWTPGSGMVKRYGKTARSARAERAARRMTLADGI